MARLRTCIAHSEELFRVLAIAFPSEGPRHGKAELEATIIVRDDLPVAALPTGGCVSRILDAGRFYQWPYNVNWQRKNVPCGLLELRGRESGQ